MLGHAERVNLLMMVAQQVDDLFGAVFVFARPAEDRGDLYSDAGVREAAAAALWKSEKGAEPARAQLLAALDDPAPQVAINVAGALLVKLFGTPAREEREYAARAAVVRDTGVRIMPTSSEPLATDSVSVAALPSRNTSSMSG